MSHLASSVSSHLGAGRHPLAGRSPEVGRGFDSTTTTAAAEQQPTRGPGRPPAPAARPPVVGPRRPGRIIKTGSMPRPAATLPGIRRAYEPATSHALARRRPSSSSNSSSQSAIGNSISIGGSSNSRTMSYNNGYMPPGRHPRQTSGSAQSPNAMNAFSTEPLMIDPSQQFNNALYQPYASPAYPIADMPAANVMSSPGLSNFPGENEIQREVRSSCISPDQANHRQKRKQQNRNAQKAFRVRNTQRIKDLENKLENVSGELQQTKSENAHLRTEKEQLEYEIQKLKEENYRIQAGQGSPGQWGSF